MDTPPVLAFHNVSISFGGPDLLHNVSFSLAPRETKILLGETGSGKTLLLKLAAGLLRPTAGRIFVLDHEVSAMSELDLLDFRRQLGFVFQEGALFDSQSVAQNVAYRLLEEGASDEEAEPRVREALRFVELEDAYDKFPAELSGGMRRRVSIARAIIDHPPLVLNDSPTAGLDPVTAQTIITLLLRLRDLQGITSLLATHRLQDGFGLANFRFDQSLNRVLPLASNGHHPPAPPPASPPSAAASASDQSVEASTSGGRPAPSTAAPATSFLFLRDGQIHFHGDQHAILNSSDSYVRSFLV